MATLKNAVRIMDGMMFASDPFGLDSDITHVNAEMHGVAGAGEFPRSGSGNINMGIAASQMASRTELNYPPAQDGAGSMYVQGSRSSGEDKYSMVHQPSQHGAMMAHHQHQHQHQQEDMYLGGGGNGDFSVGQHHQQQYQARAAYGEHVGGGTRGAVMQGPAQSMGGAAAMGPSGSGGVGSGYGQQQLIPEQMMQMQQMQQQMHRQQQQQQQRHHHLHHLQQQQQQQQQQQGPPHVMTHAQHHPRLQQQQPHQHQQHQKQHHHHHHQPLDAGNASTSPVPHSGMSPAVPMIPSHQGNSMSQRQVMQEMQRVFNHVQKCQLHISEAMNKSSALKMNLQEWSPEVSRQLQQYMPDTFIPAVAQTFTAATEEIAGYLNMGPDGSDRSMGYGPMDGQAGAMAQGRGQQQQMQQIRPGASWHMNSSMSPAPMSPHDGSAVSLQAGHPQRGDVMSFQSGGQHGRVMPQGMGYPPAGMHQSQSQAEWPYGGMSGQMQQSARPDMGGGQDDVVILSQSGTFSSDLPHARAHCTKKPFKIVKDRLGEEGGQGNEQYCENCFCYVCDVKASECQGWLRVGHCHANEKESFWRALREFTSREVLCNSPLLQAMGCDEEMQMESHKSCINGLLAFHSYRTGEVGPKGVIEHDFRHVTDAASSVMKLIIGHLSDPKGPKTTVAILDGITSAMVVNSWQPSPTQDTANHKWPTNTLEAYKVILEQLEKYWVLAIVRTSTRSVPPPALEVMANRLRELSELAREKIPDIAEGEYSPLSQAVTASERGWKHPVVVAILDGQCTDATQAESQVLQWARLHLLEHAQRWKEAYHYALFHGRIAKSLAFLVRAGRHADVLPMVLSQSAIAAYSKRLNVCQELVSANQANSAIRLAMFCAFGKYEATSDEEALQEIRLSYVNWVLGHLIGQMTQDEFKARNSFDIVSPYALEARAAAESWAQDVMTDLAQNFLQPLAEPPEGAMYSFSSLSMERVAALCALGMPRLALGCAKQFSNFGDHFGALSVVILAVPQADDAVIQFGVQELLPQVGRAAFMATTERWEHAELGYAAKMSVASLLLELEEYDKAIRFAVDANLIGAPSEDEVANADFSSPREYRVCDLMPFLSCAQTRDVDSALLLARLQMWWDPSWSHFQAIASMCSAHEGDMHRQQLQTLVYNDTSCRADVRFEVLVREGMVQQAVELIEKIVKPHETANFEVLRDCFNVLGTEFFSQNSAVLDALWPLLQETVQLTPEVDVAMEVLVLATPHRTLSLYNSNLDMCQQHCQQNAVNATSKKNLKNWLMRTKRMYLAASQNSEWERRLREVSSSLKRKSSMYSIFADVAEPGQVMSPGTPGMSSTSSSRPAKSSRSVAASPMSQSMPSTPMPSTPMPVTPMPSTPAYQ